jgi:hypothetical protein
VLFRSHFVRLINALAVKHPEQNIVIRPHPVEDHDTYRHIFRGHGNVHVAHEGAVAAWLLASRLLVQNGCTTALEAYFLGTKIITYKPIEDIEANLFLPNALGTACATEEEALAKISEHLSSGSDAPENAVLDPRVNRLIANFESAAGTDRLLGVLTDAQRAAAAGASERHLAWAVNEAIHRITSGAKDLVRPLFPERQRRHLHLTSSSMYSGFVPADISRRVGEVSRILGKDLRLQFHGPELFSLEEGQ